MPKEGHNPCAQNVHKEQKDKEIKKEGERERERERHFIQVLTIPSMKSIKVMFLSPTNIPNSSKKKIHEIIFQLQFQSIQAITNLFSAFVPNRPK